MRHSSVIHDQESAQVRSKSKIALAFVGSVVPDRLDFQNSAFNRAGNMFQENLLIALKSAGLPPYIILSQRPLRSFPKSRTIWSSHNHVSLTSGLPVNLVPFLNLPILRPLAVGLIVLANLIHWGWRYRHIPQRVIYGFNLTEPPGLFTLIAARLIRAKAIASVNDINIPGETVAATFSRKLDFYMQRHLIPRFDGLVVVNRHIIEDFAPDVPYVRIEGGVPDTMLIRATDVSRVSERTNTPFTIVSAGTLNEANGIEEILEAFSLLPGEGYRLRIAGTGPLEEHVKDAAQADTRIEYCGYLSFEQILALYDSADVLINMRLTRRLNTTYFFPSKMMEYLASGVPVITTCTGHIAEEYADIAYLLHDETPVGLAQLIEQVASIDPAVRAQKGRAAQDYMRINRTWQAQGSRIVEFIQKQVVKA